MAKVKANRAFTYQGAKFQEGVVYEVEDAPAGFIDRWIVRHNNGVVLPDNATDEAEPDPRLESGKARAKAANVLKEAARAAAKAARDAAKASRPSKPDAGEGTEEGSPPGATQLPAEPPVATQLPAEPPVATQLPAEQPHVSNELPAPTEAVNFTSSSNIFSGGAGAEASSGEDKEDGDPARPKLKATKKS